MVIITLFTLKLQHLRWRALLPLLEEFLQSFLQRSLDWVCDWRINSNKQAFLLIPRQKIKPKERSHLGWFAGTEARYKLREHANINIKSLEAFSVVGYQRDPENHLRAQANSFHRLGSSDLLPVCHSHWPLRLRGVKFRLEFCYLLWGSIIRKKKIQWRVRISHSTLIKHAIHLLKHLLIGVREVRGFTQMWSNLKCHKMLLGIISFCVSQEPPWQKVPKDPSSRFRNDDVKHWGGYLSTPAAQHIRHILLVSHVDKCKAQMSHWLRFKHEMCLYYCYYCSNGEKTRFYILYYFSLVIFDHSLWAFMTSYQENQLIIRNNHSCNEHSCFSALPLELQPAQYDKGYLENLGYSCVNSDWIWCYCKPSMPRLEKML